MLTCKQIIDSAESVYIESVDSAALRGAFSELDEIIKAGRPTGENLRRAEALSFCIMAKALTIDYLSSEYSPEAYSALKEYIDSSISKLESTDYTNTVRTFSLLRRVMARVMEIMADAVELVYQVRDSEGRLSTSSVELLGETLAIFKQKEMAARELGDTSEIFGGFVNMLDISGRVCSDVGEVCEWIEKNLTQMRAAATDEFFKKYTHPLSDEPGDKGFEYYPPISKNDNSSAKAIVILSPLYDEVVLFARAFERENSVSFTVIAAHGFSDKEPEFIDCVFDLLASKNQNALIFGLSDYHAPNKDALLLSIVRYSLKNKFALINDNVGDKALYEEIYRLTKEKAGFTGLDVSYRYLLLPPFAEVAEELEEKGMITPLDHDFLRKSAAFMGYVGFNEAISLFLRGKKWRDEVCEVSDRHEAASERYLKNIPTQAQFIDTAWRIIDLVRDTVKPKREFDYDSLRGANPKNIRIILEAEISLPAKCGMIARYCALHGDDISIWKNLSAEEKSERLLDATRLVAHLLNNQYEPEVEIISDKDWPYSKTTVGVCCDGGKRIVYREGYSNDYAGIIQTVCHECFHGFQHTAINNGWLPWHWQELGASKNRVNEWRDNHLVYFTSSKNRNAYRYQIFEADANAFERDCYEQSEEVYHTINLE